MLKDDIDKLEHELGVRAVDDAWSFDNVGDGSALNDIIFNLTPFEKSVYDSIDGITTFEDIKKALVRYKSKNFENKIEKNLDSLIEKGMVEKVGGNYRKTNL